jgi:hypothetical protein
MPEHDELRIHFEYRTLYIADLRFVFRHLERVYNQLERSVSPNWRKRVKRSERLKLEAINTETASL